MLPEWIGKYIGGGLLAILVYVIISNTLWLLIGAKFLQFLPGVNDKSSRGTYKIVLLVILCLVGIVWWSLRLIPALMGIITRKPLADEISKSIQKASKLHSKFEKKT
jgi:hypothetical protein